VARRPRVADDFFARCGMMPSVYAFIRIPAAVRPIVLPIPAIGVLASDQRLKLADIVFRVVNAMACRLLGHECLL
jgi:hypothetical protein